MFPFGYNPFYLLSDSPAMVFAWLLFAAAVVFAAALLARHQECTRAVKTAGAYGIGMLLIAADVTNVAKTDPIEGTRLSSNLDSFDFPTADSTTVFWQHTLWTSALIGIACIALLGWHTVRAIAGRHVMMSGGLIVTLVATVAITFDVTQSLFDIDTSSWATFADASDRAWDVLALVIVAYALVALATVVRPRYMKLRKSRAMRRDTKLV